LDYIWNANLRGFSVCYLSCSTHWFALLHIVLAGNCLLQERLLAECRNSFMSACIDCKI